MPETTTGPARIAAQTPAAPSPTPGTPETDPADLDAIAARNAHRRCHHCDMPLDDDQRCPNCGSETPDDVGALVAEVRRLRHQHGKVAGELVDATMTMWHLEPGDRSDMPLAERITTLVAELARQRDAAAAERDRIRGAMERCVFIDPRRQSGTPVEVMEDALCRRVWAAALRWAANCAAEPFGQVQDGDLDSTDLRQMAGRIEAGTLTPWADDAPARQMPDQQKHSLEADGEGAASSNAAVPEATDCGGRDPLCVHHPLPVSPAVRVIEAARQHAAVLRLLSVMDGPVSRTGRTLLAAVDGLDGTTSADTGGQQIASAQPTNVTGGGSRARAADADGGTDE